MRILPRFREALFFAFFGSFKALFLGSFFAFRKILLRLTNCKNRQNILKISGKIFRKNIIIYIDFCRGLWYNYKGVLCKNGKLFKNPIKF